MEYDMSFFLTIASVSASFVAIIGGFIASKLISINSERETVISRISELDEEISFREAETFALKKVLEKDDALDFIQEHINSVITKDNLHKIYDNHSPQYIDYSTMKPYWDRAIELYEKFESLFSDLDVNNDGVPNSIAAKIIPNEFDYKVCQKIMMELTDSPAIWIMSSGSLIESKAHNDWYHQTETQYELFSREIDLLNLQKQQLENRKKELVKPKNMILGLYIFGGISCFNIFVPLLLCLLLPNYPLDIYNIFKWLSLASLSIGLAITFAYLFNLLGWNPKKKP